MQATDLGLRDGVLFEFTGRQLKKDLRDETVESFQKRYQVNLMQAQHVPFDKSMLIIFRISLITISVRLLLKAWLPGFR